jgi:hypothetical protein
MQLSDFVIDSNFKNVSVLLVTDYHQQSGKNLTFITWGVMKVLILGAKAFIYLN